jgi:RHS repeat-associated protein
LTTTYLYGLGPIAEFTNAWSYSLPDGSNTPRQMTDVGGAVTLTSSYTPWGDTLEVHGTGNFSFGYFGGIMDTATGLLYVGNGQYYDPQTGRFLNRNTKPEQNNPYVPWGGNPSSALIGPLGLLALVYSRKKKRSRWDNIVIAAVLCLAMGGSLVGCTTTYGPYNVTLTPAPNNPQNINFTVTPTTTPSILPTIQGTLVPAGTLVIPDCSQYLNIIRIPSDRLVAARIFYEGTSTYYKGSNSQETDTIPEYQALFVKMVYAVKSLYEKQGNGVGYAEFTRYDPGGRKLLSIADPAGNHWELKDEVSFKGSSLDQALPDWAVVNTNAILSDTPCPNAPHNPFSNDAMSDGIHWLSPTAFPRWDVGTEKHMIQMPDVVGCDSSNGCQHNDIRQLQHMKNAAGKLKDLAKEEFAPFVWAFSKVYLKAPQDLHGNTECYWRGVYFIPDTNWNFAIYQPDPQTNPIGQDYADGKFLCP